MRRCRAGTTAASRRVTTTAWGTSTRPIQAEASKRQERVSAERQKRIEKLRAKHPGYAIDWTEESGWRLYPIDLEVRNVPKELAKIDAVLKERREKDKEFLEGRIEKMVARQKESAFGSSDCEFLRQLGEHVAEDAAPARGHRHHQQDADQAEGHRPDRQVADLPRDAAAGDPAPLADPDREHDAEDDAQRVAADRDGPEVPHAVGGARDGHQGHEGGSDNGRHGEHGEHHPSSSNIVTSRASWACDTSWSHMIGAWSSASMA